MLQDYSDSIIENNIGTKKPNSKHNWLMLVVLPVWVFIGFFSAQIIVSGLAWVLVSIGVPLKSLNESVLNTLLAAILYLITLVIVLILPWLIRKNQISLSDIGLPRLPSWTDILLAPAGFVIYILLSTALIMLATQILPGFNTNQVQNTGFGHLSLNFEYILAFITLVIVAPVAEEVLFRGYLFGRLKKYVPVWAAIIATSVLFGLVHGSWQVGIDTFSLSVILCLLREMSGSIWPSILLHMIKNSIAFYLLFIYPTLLTTLVR